MSPRRTFSDAAGDLVETAAEVVASAVQAAGDVAADLVETAGNAVQDGSHAGGEVVGRIPAVGGFLQSTAVWSGGVMAGVANLAGSAIKGPFGIAAGGVGGALKVGGGVLLLNRALVVGGLNDLGASIAGKILVVLGTLVSLIQRVLLLQRRDRALTRAEQEMLRRVFHRSISLYNVRLVEGRSGLFGVNDRPFTLGNTIYLKTSDVSAMPEVLVHECAHVWQYQNVGPRYAIEALGAQALLADAYDWEAEIVRGRTAWTKFNREAQAQLIEDSWLRGSLTVEARTTTGAGAFFNQEAGTTATVQLIFNGTDHTTLAVGAAASLRARRNARWSKTL